MAKIIQFTLEEEKYIETELTLYANLKSDYIMSMIECFINQDNHSEDNFDVVIILEQAESDLLKLVTQYHANYPNAHLPEGYILKLFF